jgi:hypothetical protein
MAGIGLAFIQILDFSQIQHDASCQFGFGL